MNETDASIKVESMKLPEFLNTSEKWFAVVESIDTAKKFDDIAIKVLDDDDIDVFEFQDIMIQLADDVKDHRPNDGEFITSLTDTIIDLIDYLVWKSEERFINLINKTVELDEKLSNIG